MFRSRQMYCVLLMGIILPLIGGASGPAARAQAPAKFPTPGTYVTWGGDNNAFEWTTTIKDDGTFNASVKYKTRSGSGNGQWKVDGGRLYFRWEKVPDFLEQTPGTPKWIEVTDQFKGKSPNARRLGSFRWDENAPVVAATATLLAKDEKYKAVGKKTKCSEFVRDFAKKLGGSLPELQGNAGKQFDNLWEASKNRQSGWVSLDAPKDPEKAFQRAQEAEDDGKFVVAAWKNPTPKTDSGHIAVVVPRRAKDQMSSSGSWGKAVGQPDGIQVPFIAQAGAPVKAKNSESVFSYLPLSYGFGSDKKDTLHIFVLERP
jgi:hypothetical protein